MGREAHCACRWGSREGAVTALLEATEIIIRGGLRGRIGLRDVTDVRISGDVLAFTFEREPVTLALGTAKARRWANAIATPPPSLAQKLGITSATSLYVSGVIDDDALRAACAEASPVADAKLAGVAIVRTDDIGELLAAAAILARREPGIPVWVVYTKGRAAPLGETAVRATLRASGFMDTKVASVSPTLTALRFTRAQR